MLQPSLKPSDPCVAARGAFGSAAATRERGAGEAEWKGKGV